MNDLDRRRGENQLRTALQAYLDRTSFPRADAIHQLYTDHGYAWIPRPDPDAWCPRHWSTRLPCGLCYIPPATDVTPGDREPAAVVLPDNQLGDRIRKYLPNDPEGA